MRSEIAMALTKIHCGDWSASVRQDNPLFATFFESQKELVGSVPTELRFDDWDWLPKQWEQLLILMAIVDKDWKWDTYLLDLHFGIVHYADVSAIAGAMLDLPKGWETCTVIDKRTSLEDRKRLYKQNGQLILESILEGEEPKWYIEMTSDRVRKGETDTLERRLHTLIKMADSSIDLLVGAMWDAYLKESIAIRDNLTVVDWEAVWSEYGQELSMTVNRSHNHDSDQSKSVHTLRYLASPHALFVSGIQVSTTSVTCVMDKVEADNGKFFAFKRDLYDVSLRGYLASPECSAYSLNLKSVDVDLKESPVCPVDEYASHVHAHLITIARVRLCNIHKDDRLSKLTIIPKEYHFAIALFLLSIIGRNSAIEMSDRLGGTQGSILAYSCFRTWDVYRHDSTFPSKMRKSFREDEFDHLLSILTMPLESETPASTYPRLSLVDDKWMATLWYSKAKKTEEDK